MSTIHKKKSAVPLEKKIAQQKKQEQKKQEEQIKEEQEKLKQEEEKMIEEQLESPSDPRVINRYEQAAEIANKALALAKTLCKENAVIYNICKEVNDFIEKEAKAAYTGEFQYESGVAFPCCMSVDNCCGYFCPLKDDKTALKKGQIAKIELAANVSGFIAEVCDTIVVDSETVTDEQKRVIEAGYTALQEVIAKLQPGVDANEITTIVDNICKKYEVKAFENIVSRNMERYMIDGQKFILNVPSKQAVEEMKIEVNEVWNLDIILSSGQCKPMDNGTRTTVYKRNIDETYILKMRTSVQILREINHKFPTMPFSLGMLENESKAKMGIVEIAKYDLVDTYTVLFEKKGLVSQFKATVIVTENGPKVLTPVEAPFFMKKE